SAEQQVKLNNIQSFKGSNYVYTVEGSGSGVVPELNGVFKSKGWNEKRLTNNDIKDIVDNKIPEVQEEIKEATRLPVRYIRDWLSGSDKNNTSHWVEIQAIQSGTKDNVAKGKTAIGSQAISNV